MYSNFYLPKLYLSTKDDLFFLLVKKHFQALECLVLKYQLGCDLKDARYFLLDLRFKDQDLDLKNLFNLFTLLFNSKIKTVVILPEYQRIENISWFKEIIDLALECKFCLVFVGLIFEKNNNKFLIHSDLDLSSKNKVVSCDYLLSFLEKCFFSVSYQGKTFEIGNIVLIDKENLQDQVIKVSTVLDKTVTYLADSSLSYLELKELFSSEASFVPQKNGRVSENINKDIVSKEEFSTARFRTLEQDFGLTNQKKHKKHFLTKLKGYFFWFVFMFVSFLAFPYFIFFSTYLTGYFYERTKVSRFEDLHKNFTIVGKIVNKIYLSLPFIGFLYEDIDKYYYFFKKYIYLNTQEKAIKNSLRNTFRNSTLDPFAFENYVSELALFERNLKFLLADYNALPDTKKSLLGIFVVPKTQKIDKISVLKNLSFDFLRSIRGDFVSQIAIVFADSNKLLGFGAVIEKIIIIDLPYYGGSVILWEGIDLAEKTLDSGKIESSYSLYRFTGNRNWHLKYAMWDLSYEQSFDMLHKFINEKQKERITNLRHILYVDLDFLKDIGWSSPDGDFFSRIGSLIANKDVENIFAEALAKKQIVYWNKDLSLRAEGKKVANLIDNHKCELCHKDLFGVFESNARNEKQFPRKAKIDISFQERLIKYRLTYKIDKKAPEILRVLVPFKASVGTVSLVGDANYHTVIPNIEISDIGKIVVLSQEDIKEVDKQIVFEWEMDSKIDTGEYQLILKHQPGSIINYEINLSLPSDISVETEDFMLTDKGLYTYNTVLSRDLVFKLKFNKNE